MAYCTRCGTAGADGTAYCTTCGAALGPEPAGDVKRPPRRPRRSERPGDLPPAAPPQRRWRWAVVGGIPLIGLLAVGAMARTSPGVDPSRDDASVGAPTATPASDRPSPTQSDAPGPDPSEDDDATSSSAPEAIEIASGTFAMFTTLQLGSTSEQLTLPDASLSWDRTDYGAIQYVPDTGQTILLRTTSSASYARGYLYPRTQAGRVFLANVSSDVGTVRLAEYDPRTGQHVDGLAYACEFTANNIHPDGFAVLGDRIYYRTPIGTDLAGNPRSGGELAVDTFPCSNDERILQPFPWAQGTPPSLFAVGDDLVAAFAIDGRYRLFTLHPDTGDLAEALLEIPEDAVFNFEFFPGNDALYWAQHHEDALHVVRYPVGGDAYVVASLPVDGGERPYALGIDEDQGYVFVVFRDSEPRFYLHAIEDGTTSSLAIDPELFSSGADANGQFLFVP